MVAALALVGSADTWQPLSVAPYRTLAALLALGPPLVMLWYTSRSTGRELFGLVTAVTAMCLVAVVVGAGQLAQGPGGWLDFYATGDTGILHGFNANRNTAADILLVGIVALAALWSQWHPAQAKVPSLALAGLAALLVLAVFLTGSRSGIALTPLALGFALAIMRTGKGAPGMLPGKRTWLALSTLGLAMAAAGWWWRTNPAIARVLARFDFGGEFRPELWRDAWYAVWQYWPVGSGLGTFIPAMLPSERLEVVDATLPNRAHNELLEMALEGGLPLLACWAAVAVIVLWRLPRALSVDSCLPRQYGLLAAAILAIATLHSLVDYPLRSMAMASLVAMAAGIVLSAGSRTIRTV
jgi:O-antigen ligase